MTDILKYAEAPTISKLRIEVEFCAYGVLIFGNVPTSFFEDMGQRYPYMVPGVANAEGATLALVATKEQGEEWSRDIDRDAERDHDNLYKRWLSGARVGLSSAYLLRLLLLKQLSKEGDHQEEKAALTSHLFYKYHKTEDMPGDDDDRGRCVRMLKQCGFTVEDVLDIPEFAAEVPHFLSLWSAT